MNISKCEKNRDGIMESLDEIISDYENYVESVQTAMRKIYDLCNNLEIEDGKEEINEIADIAREFI